MAQFNLIHGPITTTLLVTRCVTIGLSGCRIQQRVELPDSLYGEFYYHRRGLPLWYFNSFEPSLTGSRLQAWLDENMKRFGGYESAILYLLRKGDNRNISITAHPYDFEFPIGKPYTMQYELKQLVDITGC